MTDIGGGKTWATLATAVALLAAGPVGAQGQQKPASVGKPLPTVRLFDGKTLSGWERKAVHGGNGGIWAVQNGLLVGDQEPEHKGGLLGTTRSFGDAVIELEFKAVGFPLDSGLFLRTQPNGNGYQLTIDIKPDGSVGSIYVPSDGFVAQDKTWKSKYRENNWNTLKAEITGQPARVRVWLNGQQTVDFTDTKERLPRTGYVGLQVHGGGGSWGADSRIQYRNVRVTPLATNVAGDDPLTSKRTQWWRDAKYGMFVHWGVYAAAAGYWDGKPVSGAGEWIMNTAKIAPTAYESLAPKFHPTAYDARAWARLAKDAGMKYLVITSKHHDGFALYPTKVNRWNVADATPFTGRDPLKELADACRAEGIRFGLYYSIMDWHDPNAVRGKADASYVPRMKEQLREVITRYQPSVLWFDGEWVDWWDEAKGRDLEAYVRSLKPDVIVNNRVGKRKLTDGDYETPEQEIPRAALGERLWETCMTLNDTWGYKRDDNNWKSSEGVVRRLADIAGKGGNFLLNVGPDATGVIPAESAHILREAGAWVRANGEAIYGTTYAPLPAPAWGRLTRKGDTLYAIVLDRPKTPGAPLRLEIADPVSKASLLRGGATVRVAAAGPGAVDLYLPEAASAEPLATVVKLTVPGGALTPVRSRAERTAAGEPLPAQANGSYALSADGAALRGGGPLRLEGDAVSNIGYWTDAKGYVEWFVAPERPATYAVEVEYACEPGNGGPFAVQVGPATVGGKAEPTGGWQSYRTLRLGTVSVPAGRHAVTVKATGPFSGGLMNLRAVRLVRQ